MKILGFDPYSQWMSGEFPFDRAKSCNLCVTQHGAHTGTLCRIASHQALKRVARKLIKPWTGAAPQTEEQAQEILKLRQKFYRFFKAAPNAN